MKEHEDFKQAVAEKFRDLNLAFDENNHDGGDIYDLDYDEAVFDDDYAGSFF